MCGPSSTMSEWKYKNLLFGTSWTCHVKSRWIIYELFTTIITCIHFLTTGVPRSDMEIIQRSPYWLLQFIDSYHELYWFVSTWHPDMRQIAYLCTWFVDFYFGSWAKILSPVIGRYGSHLAQAWALIGHNKLTLWTSSEARLVPGFPVWTGMYCTKVQVEVEVCA